MRGSLESHRHNDRTRCHCIPNSMRNRKSSWEDRHCGCQFETVMQTRRHCHCNWRLRCTSDRTLDNRRSQQRTPKQVHEQVVEEVCCALPISVSVVTVGTIHLTGRITRKSGKTLVAGRPAEAQFAHALATVCDVNLFDSRRISIGVAAAATDVIVIVAVDGATRSRNARRIICVVGVTRIATDTVKIRFAVTAATVLSQSAKAGCITVAICSNARDAAIAKRASDPCSALARAAECAIGKDGRRLDVAHRFVGASRRRARWETGEIRGAALAGLFRVAIRARAAATRCSSPRCKSWDHHKRQCCNCRRRTENCTYSSTFS